VTAAVGAVTAGTVSANRDATAATGSTPPQRTAPPSTSACPLPQRYRSAFETAARETDLPLALLTAVGRVESGFHAEARSQANARGLMQVLPTTAQALGLDADEPAANVLAGARYLRLLFDRFHSSDLALAAYNAGPTAVQKAGGAPSLTTLRYVVNTTAAWRELQGCR
jgi:peptidoglycan DL-endopeptidase CwlO